METKLPNEFYEWLSGQQYFDNVLNEPTYWLEELPKSCQQALVVEWLEGRKIFMLASIMRAMDGFMKYIKGFEFMEAFK